MNNKIKNYIVKLVMLENKILEKYKNIIEKEINNQDIGIDVQELKELIKKEEFLYDLSYDEINIIIDYIENYDSTYSLLTQRMLNLLDMIIEEKHLKERLEESTEEEYDDETIECIKLEDNVIRYIIRDLVLLRIKKLDERIRECKDKNIKNRLITYKYEYLFSEIENQEEIIDKSFNFENLNLISNLAIEFSCIDSEIIEEIKNELAENEMLSITNLINLNEIVKTEGINKENKQLIETELLLNISFLEAECEIFTISKESIIYSVRNILKDKDIVIVKSINEKFNNKKTNYLTLKRKK